MSTFIQSPLADWDIYWSIHILAGCYSWGWKLGKDKPALEDQEPGWGSLAPLWPDSLWVGRVPAGRHLHRIRGHCRAGGLLLCPDSVLPRCWSVHHPMYSRPDWYPQQCDVSIVQTLHFPNSCTDVQRGYIFESIIWYSQMAHLFFVLKWKHIMRIEYW